MTTLTPIHPDGTDQIQESTGSAPLETEISGAPVMISIVVPVYNAGKYLRACLDSIRAQTHKDFESWLVDDGSQDESGEICDEYANFRL